MLVLGSAISRTSMGHLSPCFPASAPPFAAISPQGTSTLLAVAAKLHSPPEVFQESSREILWGGQLGGWAPR